MSSYRLIVDAERSSLFTGLGPPRLVTSLQLHLFPACQGPIPGTIRQQILAINSAGATALAVPERPWKAVLFDMDSTVIAEESIVELARAAGRQEEVHRITEQAMAGLLDFKSALRQRVAMLRGVPSDVIDKVGQTLTINPGMHEFAKAARARGIELHLVSGGFNPLAARIVRELDFQGFRANELAVADGQLTGELIGEIVDAEVKANYLDELCKKRGFSPDEVVAVGDGANDLPMLLKAGAAIGYHPKAVLLPHIHGANLHDHRVLVHALL
ncbi:MAG TPA: phosphoserine phosphatase SerB [Oligoflexus sp.]|uniref:phosphoserine phosphatase SerB n=1 Tax=Oligoflexus sp. TaxID=1971216 RepID=UPI002D7FC294|nr:phosphoserine phosphatase SerB [Oligoflexus sp.]HET9240641.1 phosphoserine phosphatase SerB [Oligoflexus sp.]